MKTAWTVLGVLTLVGCVAGKSSGNDVAEELELYETMGGLTSPSRACAALLDLCETQAKGCLAHDVYCTENLATSDVCAELTKLCDKGSPTACAAQAKKCDGSALADAGGGPQPDSSPPARDAAALRDASAPPAFDMAVRPDGWRPSATELQGILDDAKANANARLAAMRAAHQAWRIPSRPDLVAGATNVRSSGGLKADGVTNNTAALQSLLSSRPSGATLYFPAGTYRIDGPVSITKPVTLLGEAGTVLDFQKATEAFVLTINKAGTTSSRMSGVAITGMVIEGPGIETSPTMIYANALQGFHVSYVKFHNVGTASLRLNGCLDAVVEDCVFDNVYRTGYGYGVSITDYSDNVTVRDSFFVTKGRHGVATGTANNALPVAGYTKRVTIENNYFENFTDQTTDAHVETVGPYLARGNVMVNSRVGINLRAGLGELSNNVFVDCPTGILLRNQEVSASSIGSKVDKIVGNTMLGVSVGMQIDKTNSLIQNNVMQGTGSGTAIHLGPTAYAPKAALITGNVVEGFRYGFQSEMTSSGITRTNNYIKVSGTFQTF